MRGSDTAHLFPCASFVTVVALIATRSPLHSSPSVPEAKEKSVEFAVDELLGSTTAQVLAAGDCYETCFFVPVPDGFVNAADLAGLLSLWGPCAGCCPDTVTSLTFMPPPDGVIDGADLAALLGNWFPAPPGWCD